MSLQQYFNHKKNILVTFFSNFQHLLHELSIVVQLEIDNQYFTAKNVMKQATSDVVESYCKDMMGKESELLRRITETVCGHVGQYCGLGRQRVKTFQDIKKNQEIYQEKTSEKKLISTVQSQPKRSTEIGRVMSLDRFQKSQETTAYKMKNIRGLDTVSKNSLQLFNLKTKIKQQKQSKQNEQQLKSALPINLLNRKRQNSSRKSQDTNRKDSGIQIENKDKLLPRNYSGQMYPYSMQKQKQTPSQFHQKLSYEKYRQMQSRGRGGEDFNLSDKQSNVWPSSSKASEIEPKTNGGIIQNNQFLCEKLDQKIQQSAMEILNKVKHKRSPAKKKTYQSINNKSNKPANAFSVLDISQNSILLTRPSVLRVHK